MTDTVHEYVEETDVWDRRIKRLLGTILLHPTLTDNERAVLMQTLVGKNPTEIADDYGFSRQRAQDLRQNAWIKVSRSLYGIVEEHINWYVIFNANGKKDTNND